MNFISMKSDRKECPFKEKCYRRNPIHFSEMSHPYLEKLVISQLDNKVEVPKELNFECADPSQLREQLRILQSILRRERDTNKENFLVLYQNLTGSKNIESISMASTSNVQSNLQPDDDWIPDKRRKLSNHAESTSKNKGTSIIEEYESSDSAKARKEKRERAIKKMREAGFALNLTELGKFAAKHALASPYYVFYTRVEHVKETHNEKLSVTLPEILDVSFGEIIESLVSTFMVDVGWLCLQYLLAAQSTNITLLYGEREDSEKLNDNIKLMQVKVPTAFGCHHSKFMILKYKNGIRVVVMTANLYSEDWENRTQGVWISPHLPFLPESADSKSGESKTEFKKDFKEYLASYRVDLQKWINVVDRVDFSSVNVVFIGSIPGSHKNSGSDSWGHRKVRKVLGQHAVLPPTENWPVIAQCSSIGSLGVKYESWLKSDFLASMSQDNSRTIKSVPSFYFIFPTTNNFKESLDCRKGCCCLCYTVKMHSKQQWIETYMCQWKATKSKRSRAMPHLKSYTRISPDCKSIAWFILTSANLSKAAWGNINNILNYEAGVLFLPKFISETTSFPIDQDSASNVPSFPIIYDLPVTRYNSEDSPFATEAF